MRNKWTVVVSLAMALAACNQPVSPAASPSTVSAPVEPAPTQDVRIALGESARVTVGPGDAYMPFDEFGDAWHYRVVRVVVNQLSRVEIRVTAEDNGPLQSWEIRNSKCCTWVSSDRNDMIDVPANTELEVQLRHYEGIQPTTRTYVVSTRRIEV